MKLSSFFGFTRQAYYKSMHTNSHEISAEIFRCILNRRKELPREGIRKLYQYIKNTDYQISRNTLTELLQREGLIIKWKRAYRVITDSSHSSSVSENLLRKNKPEHVFEVLVSDITYLRTKEREYYLTAIMDLYARIILSYCLTDHLGSDGLIRAFMLIAKKYISKLEGCIFHSDRGIQFCSSTFKELAMSYGVILSNSRKGNPYDNACMERLFATLKNEYMLNIRFPDFNCLNKALANAVHSYNNHRLHISLNYKTPKEFFLADLKSY